MRLPRRSYDRYIRSVEWIERRRQYLTDHGGCVICGSAWADVHHMDYRHLGNEPDADLLALCTTHHEGVHAYYERNRASMTLRQATAAFVAGFGGPEIDPGDSLADLRNHERWLELVTVACPECEAQPGEACTYLHRGRVRIVTAGGAHRKRKTAATRARRLAS